MAEGSSRYSMPAGSTEGASEDRLTNYSVRCRPVVNGAHLDLFTLCALNAEKLAVDGSPGINHFGFEQKYSASFVPKIELQENYSRLFLAIQNIGRQQGFGIENRLHRLQAGQIEGGVGAEFD